jgi:hypothetical protein
VNDTADFLIADYGSMVALTPMTAKAMEACQDGTIIFEDWQVIGRSIMVDHRLASDLVGHLEGEFTITAE